MLTGQAVHEDINLYALSLELGVLPSQLQNEDVSVILNMLTILRLRNQKKDHGRA